MTAVMKTADSLDQHHNAAGNLRRGGLRRVAGRSANPLFRAARFEELVIEDNPYRRPVRPDDLQWLRFDTPPTREDFGQLSALLGHRMLLNIYDARRPLLAAAMTDEKWHDFDLFYSAENLARGERVRPFLERHVFDFVHQATGDLDLGGDPVAGVAQLLHRVGMQRQGQSGQLMELISGSGNPARAATTMVIQLIASALNAPTGITAATARRSVDAATSVRQLPVDVVGDDGGSGAGGLVGGLAAKLGLSWQPHRYYQFYLPSTLALMNYVNATQHDHRRALAYLGAMAARTIDAAAMASAHRPETDAVLGGVPAAVDADVTRTVRWLTEHVAVPIAQRCGTRGLWEFARGVAEYATLLDVHHTDVSTQLRWIDAAAQFRSKAERLAAAIDEHQIPVHLDTFVESWEECSTTHVHDEDRLLIIESGEMEFWNSYGDTHSYGPRRQAVHAQAPPARLGGAVRQCVYHQPVITPEIDERFG